MTGARIRTPSLNNFDLLRIAAALQVVLLHGVFHLRLGRPVWWPLIEAFPGVSIFFVISGFLISRSFERSSSLASYARKRVLRIYPALWVCIGATVVAASLAGMNFLQWHAFKWFAAQLVGLIYTPAFLAGFGFGSYNGSLWTIPVELQFYCMLPVCYALLPRQKRKRDIGLFALFIFFTLIAVAYVNHVGPGYEDRPEPTVQKLFRYTFIPHFYLFLAGVVFQRLGLERSKVIVGKGIIWLAAYLVFHFCLPQNTWSVVSGSLILGVCVLSLAYTAPGLSNKVLRGNDVSYGVYIYHGLLINVFLTLGWKGSTMLLPLLVALVFLMSLASWRLIEKPALRLKELA